ncbi:helix-turn-helix transcriptional regulator [Mycobacterium paraintracellulare]|uniref:helix-turn-helix transcriptional regulator n=1 Tax=Mycobacterium paraintracellulare TaxID=1138383 RepID=UPI0019350742|nr:DNA-binding protein [Mycobacterium paraintracellulare]BCP14856.1 hypothetical protein MINTM021_17650 [Mycobacterium paraintracellulare]
MAAEWVSRRQLADRWDLPVGTLNQWGSQGKGPRYARFGKHVRYRLVDIEAFENAQLDASANTLRSNDPVSAIDRSVANAV